MSKQNQAPQTISAQSSSNIGPLSFEDALRELEAIVQKLESGDAKLDEAIGQYERGMLLKKHCEQKLEEARLKIEKVNFKADGTATITNHEMDA